LGHLIFFIIDKDGATGLKLIQVFELRITFFYFAPEFRTFLMVLLYQQQHVEDSSFFLTFKNFFVQNKLLDIGTLA